MTSTCPVCGSEARFVVRASAHIASWNCDNQACRIGGFSTYVWPEPGGAFTPINELEPRRLAACIHAADIAGEHEMALQLRKERDARSAEGAAAS